VAKLRSKAPVPTSPSALTDDSAVPTVMTPTEELWRGKGEEEPPPPAALSEGATVSHFRVIARLGRGGMGVVYRAEDEHLRREVALKVLPSFHVHDAERRLRLIREARAAAAVNHPNIATVYEIGEADGRIYIAMELIHGKALRQRLSAGRLPVEDAIHIARQIASGLEKAHKSGLIHRDLKPDNVMLTDEGVAKVLDFGLAKQRAEPRADAALGDLRAAAAAPNQTASGPVFGTPRYMSPEQAQGLPLDHRSDLFSFGVMLYEMLAGRRPFDGSSVLELLTAVVREEPTPLPELCPAAPPALSELVARCLAKNPEDRFPDCASLAAELDRIAQQSGLSSSAPTVPPRPLRAEAPKGAPKLSGSRWKAGLAAFVLALLGLGGAFVLWPRRPPPLAALAPTPRALTDLPSPASPHPEAIAAYKVALESMRGGDWQKAEQHLQRAVALDPLLAAAHLRLALYFDQMGSTAESRASFTRAAQGRASLGERDQVLLQALEPIFLENPPNLPLAAQRMREATLRHPLDAELFFLSALFETHDREASLRSAQRATEIDPQYADAFQVLGVRLFDSDRMEEALGAFDRCVALAPASVDCRGERARLYKLMGRCTEMEAELRRAISTNPKASLIFYDGWADALNALERPRDVVLAALAQKWAELPEEKRRPIELFDRARLEFGAGQFARAEAHLREGSRLIQSDRNTLMRAKYASLLVQAHDEMGRPKVGVKVADDYLKRKELWQSSALSLSPTMVILRTLLHGGALSKEAFVKERSKLLTEGHGSSDTAPGTLWFLTYAHRIEQREEAEEALRELAKLPLGSPPRTTVRLFSGDLGRMYLLAGRVEEALTVLRQEPRSCASLGEGPSASLTLGQALEQKGDKAGACAAYRIVLEQWGNASPRSVTALTARAREKALGCAALAP
jgi:eukaryotic-like serine/threonine-protein kinase